MDGRVVGYDNEMVIRYLDRVVVKDDGYEARLKGGVTITVYYNHHGGRGRLLDAGEKQRCFFSAEIIWA